MKVQRTGHRQLLFIYLPKEFVEKMHLQKGDELLYSLEYEVDECPALVVYKPKS